MSCRYEQKTMGGVGCRKNRNSRNILDVSGRLYSLRITSGPTSAKNLSPWHGLKHHTTVSFYTSWKYYVSFRMCDTYNIIEHKAADNTRTCVKNLSHDCIFTSMHILHHLSFECSQCNLKQHRE